MIGEELKTMNRNERKHLNEIKEQMTQEYLDMLPDALDALRDIIGDPDINPIARVQAIGLIMDRGLGKPEENIRIQHMEDEWTRRRNGWTPFLPRCGRGRNEPAG